MVSSCRVQIQPTLPDRGARGNKPHHCWDLSPGSLVWERRSFSLFLYMVFPAAVRSASSHLVSEIIRDRHLVSLSNFFTFSSQPSGGFGPTFRALRGHRSPHARTPLTWDIVGPHLRRCRSLPS